jgi:Putative Actinobacterial Holin-X, holin superfamily III
VAEERSVSDVLQDILRNLQDIVRSEIRLAKVEIRQEVRRASSSGVWIAAGTVGVVSAWIFLLWTLAYALATRMPMWAATLVVAGVMAAAAVVLIAGGVRRAKRIQPIPERTVESVKENLEWMKQPTK